MTSLPGLVALAAPNASSEPISEIVYLAPFRRADGALTFIQAIEDLARQGLLKSQTITFLGPIDDSGGLNRNWAGLRALRWNFRFQLRDERCRKTAFDYVNRPGRLAVLFETDGSGLGRSPSPPRCLSYRLDAPSFDLADDLKKDLERAIVHGRLERPREAVDWTLLARFLEQINEAPPSRPATAVAREGASICIVHRNRSHLLSHLIESIPSEIDGQPVEIVIVDNASTPEHRAKLGALAANRIRQILLDAPLDQSRALMTGIGAARHRTILLCDDDNLFVQDGVARLCRALQRGAFDIVVSSLLVFDHAGDAPSAPAALTTFIGQAHTAGLFFNFFGDTAMCLDRDKFIAAGGFAAEAGACPCFDWMTLARMQAAGLTIGVLQEPAVLYRRDERANADNPQKLEQAGARALVFKAYRGRYVPALATRVAQNSVIDLF
ncbi:MAG TPA: glycosyltransferase [Gemmataceae bacterium]|nr:glycosyltransferase [Gemmataceae bacterium]